MGRGSMPRYSCCVNRVTHAVRFPTPLKETMSHKQGEFKYSCVYDFLLCHEGCEIESVVSIEEDESTEIGFKCKDCFEVYMYDKIEGNHGL